MSYAVVRGDPTASQEYLDLLLGRLERTGRGGKQRDAHCLGEVLFFSMKEDPQGVRFINGATDQHVTNLELLQDAVRVSRTLDARVSPGAVATCLGRNHRQLLAFYFGALFAGVVPFMQDYRSTAYEIKYFLDKVDPALVFCEHDNYEDVRLAMAEAGRDAPIVVFGGSCDAPGQGYEDFLEGADNDVDSYWPVQVDADDTALLLPTSGSTGLPKATTLTHRGLVAQLPSIWCYHKQFPRPTARALLVSGAQWMTHATVMFTSAVYRVEVVISSLAPTIEHVIDLIRQYEISWVLLGPASGAEVAAAGVLPATLETVVLTGGPVAAATMQAFNEKLPRAVVSDGYGMTEMQGFIALPDRAAPAASVGKPFNITHYKVIDDEGSAVAAGQRGELCFKSEHCLMKGYYNDPGQTAQCFTRDGWLRTGDEVTADQQGHLFYVRRIKFCFKYDRYHISPEEIERTIRGVPGVVLAVVGAAAGGVPAALVVVSPAATVTEDHVHSAVNGQLSDYKRLRGGVFFVSSVPLTPSGKLHRVKCQELLNQLSQNKDKACAIVLFEYARDNCHHLVIAFPWSSLVESKVSYG